MRRFAFWLAATTCTACVFVCKDLVADPDPSLLVTKEQETAVVNAIYKRIVAASEEKTKGEMTFYTNTIPPQGPSIRWCQLRAASLRWAVRRPSRAANRMRDLNTK